MEWNSYANNATLERIESALEDQHYLGSLKGDILAAVKELRRAWHENEVGGGIREALGEESKRLRKERDDAIARIDELASWSSMIEKRGDTLASELSRAITERDESRHDAECVRTSLKCQSDVLEYCERKRAEAAPTLDAAREYRRLHAEAASVRASDPVRYQQLVEVIEDAQSRLFAAVDAWAP